MCLRESNNKVSENHTMARRMAYESTIRLYWAAMVLVGILLVTMSPGSSAAPTRPSGETKEMMYLAQYGYLSPSVRNPTSGMFIDEHAWTKAITEFQSFAGIKITGELNDETSHLMTVPRCGVKDKVGFGESRSERYEIRRPSWPVKDLTYKITKYPRLLNRAKVDAELAKAFAVWSDYTDLTFTQKRFGQVHIEIRFERGEHGDGDPLDGPGGTLAHAFFPLHGDAHFDDAEQWSINSMRGVNLFQVAAHEFGHSLGLSHSEEKKALMTPFYRGYDPSFQLSIDDIQGIQALYGRKTQLDVGGGVGNNTPEPAAAEDPALCVAAFFYAKLIRLAQRIAERRWSKGLDRYSGRPKEPGVGIFIQKQRNAFTEFCRPKK